MKANYSTSEELIGFRYSRRITNKQNARPTSVFIFYSILQCISTNDRQSYKDEATLTLHTTVQVADKKKITGMSYIHKCNEATYLHS